MTGARQSLRDAYAATLGRHLVRADESTLLQAYELGRRALGDGLGVLDIVMLHHAALETLGAADGAPIGPRLGRAAEFLAESLSPFEMSLRGYREANARLVTMNDMLTQAKAQTDAANRELEAFSYSVAHDLRAPLRSIKGFSQALLDDYADKLDDAGRQHLCYVHESAQEMTELIDGLLMLSRVTRSDLRRERVDLAAMAQAVVSQLRKASPARAVRTTIPPELVVEGDPRLLRVLLENLIGNAWKFTSKHALAHIEVGARAQESETSYFVRDDGAGFDMAYAGKLFGVFQRLHTVNEFEGTGIGLATVKRIVDRHGGRAWAEGEVDRGATFYFTLGTAAREREAA
jgi:light-regulated signal transduction histidine kinase (bacteriophytochrome)